MHRHKLIILGAFLARFNNFQLKCAGGGNHSVCCTPQRGITRKLDQALKETLNNKAIKKETRT